MSPAPPALREPRPGGLKGARFAALRGASAGKEGTTRLSAAPSYLRPLSREVETASIFSAQTHSTSTKSWRLKKQALFKNLIVSELGLATVVSGTKRYPPRTTSKTASRQPPDTPLMPAGRASQKNFHETLYMAGVAE